ncbi:hypothetical protein [Hyphococcus luteus]|nr:hypothetical protein [Marinicaulis flavus]
MNLKTILATLFASIAPAAVYAHGGHEHAEGATHALAHFAISAAKWSPLIVVMAVAAIVLFKIAGSSKRPDKNSAADNERR